MSKYMEQYFTIGQFAKLRGINKRTLMYYDDIDLFKPAKIHDNGYRYYTNRQHALLDVILALRDMDMPLDEIKKLLQNRSPQNHLRLLYTQRDRFKKEMERIRYTQSTVETKIKLIERYLQSDKHEIFIEECPVQYLYATPTPKNISDDEWYDICYRHMEICSKIPLYGEPLINVMIGVETVLSGDLVNYSHIYTKLASKGELDCIVKPKGQYLKAFAKSAPDETGKCYEKMIEYANHHNLHLTGYFYEDCILDDAATDDYVDYVSEISVEVK